LWVSFLFFLFCFLARVPGVVCVCVYELTITVLLTTAVYLVGVLKAMILDCVAMSVLVCW